MTTVRLKYTFTDSCLSWPTLLARVFTPTVLGTATLLILRYALHLWPEADYPRPSPTKEVLVLVLVLATALLIYRPVQMMRRVSRNHFRETYIKQDTVLFHLMSGTLWSTFASATQAIMLAIVAYVIVQTYSCAELFVVGVAAAVGLWLAQVIGYLLTDSLKSHVSDLFLARARRAVLLFCLLTVVVMSSLSHGVASPWVKMDEEQVRTEIKKQVRHPNYWVQTVSRSIVYLNAKVLRIKDYVTPPIGWVIYLYLIVPNTIPLYAISCLYLGCEPLVNMKAHKT